MKPDPRFTLKQWNAIVSKMRRTPTKELFEEIVTWLSKIQEAINVLEARFGGEE